ncbi:MAG: NusG domain II-containing protein [Oscillospiraceae bacterium]|jgi:hypothetical protein|nr:NusG domain II-containing protein [Oscillospiraceae bacterium]
MRRKLYNKGDIWLLALLPAALAALLLLSRRGEGAEPPRAVITEGGGEVMSVALDKDITFTLPGDGAVAFEVRGGAIAFVSSDCPDKTCVKTGFVGRPGQMSVCVPRRLLLAVRGGERDEDTVAY